MGWQETGFLGAFLLIPEPLQGHLGRERLLLRRDLFSWRVWDWERRCLFLRGAYTFLDGLFPPISDLGSSVSSRDDVHSTS